MIKQRHFCYFVPIYHTYRVFSVATNIRRAAILKMADISCSLHLTAGKQVKSCSLWCRLSKNVYVLSPRMVPSKSVQLPFLTTDKMLSADVELNKNFRQRHNSMWRMLSITQQSIFSGLIWVLILQWLGSQNVWCRQIEEECNMLQLSNNIDCELNDWLTALWHISAKNIVWQDITRYWVDLAVDIWLVWLTY